MTVLVADVGGTNTRVALIEADLAVRDITRFANDEHSGFPDVLARFLQGRDVPPLTGCCIAVAGPVTSDRARLTNRDWDIGVDAVAEQLPGVTRNSVRLINDLVALGHALPALNRTQIEDIRPTGTGPALNDQALVAGLGTGFNICLVKGNRQSPVVIGAELGHASLPSSVMEILRTEIGSASAEFNTVETLLCGRGLSRLYRVLSAGEAQKGQDILTSYAGGQNGAVSRTVDLMARLLGVFAQDLVFHYLPFGGIHFAGGAARGILGSNARQSFLASFEAPGIMDDHMRSVPVRLITDDAAALTGAARVISRECR